MFFFSFAIFLHRVCGERTEGGRGRKQSVTEPYEGVSAHVQLAIQLYLHAPKSVRVYPIEFRDMLFGFRSSPNVGNRKKLRGQFCWLHGLDAFFYSEGIVRREKKKKPRGDEEKSKLKIRVRGVL